jgi:hypothetical protein
VKKNDNENLESKKKYNCELIPDNYMDVLDLEVDCLGFSSRYMCDFDNNEPEIKEIKAQLYEEAENLYDKYRSLVLDKNFFVNMSCKYIDSNYFEFYLVVPDYLYLQKITGEHPESMPIRFANQYSATKFNNIWNIKLNKIARLFSYPTPQSSEVLRKIPLRGIGSLRIPS